MVSRVLLDPVDPYVPKEVWRIWGIIWDPASGKRIWAVADWLGGHGIIFDLGVEDVEVVLNLYAGNGLKLVGDSVRFTAREGDVVYMDHEGQFGVMSSTAFFSTYRKESS